MSSATSPPVVQWRAKSGSTCLQRRWPGTPANLRGRVCDDAGPELLPCSRGIGRAGTCRRAGGRVCIAEGFQGCGSVRCIF